MRYLIRISNYPERTSLFDLIHMMSMIDFVANNVETLKIDIKYSLEKEFTKLILY